MRIYLAMLLTIFVASLAFTEPMFAGTLAEENAAAFDLNRASPNMMAKHRLGTKLILEDVRLARAKYDFAVQGGATGVKTLVGVDGKPVVLPSGAVVVDCLIDVITPGTTSNAGTLALGTGQAANDLKTATGATSYTGLVACTPVGTAATSIKLTANRTMTGTIANALTAGKLWVYVYYIIGGT